MNIEDRLDNWGRVVRDPRWQPQCCASWARVATALRDAAERQAAIPLLPRDIGTAGGSSAHGSASGTRSPSACCNTTMCTAWRPRWCAACWCANYGAAPSTLRHWEARGQGSARDDACAVAGGRAPATGAAGGETGGDTVRTARTAFAFFAFRIARTARAHGARRAMRDGVKHSAKACALCGCPLI